MTGYESKRAAAQDRVNYGASSNYPPQPAQEPVAWYHNDFGVVEFSRIPRAGWKPLYAAPPQRPWVGLTDEEAQWLYDNCRTPSNLIDMVEARLKEKNT